MGDDIQLVAFQTCGALHTLWTALDAKSRSEADAQLQALQDSDIAWEVSCLLAACQNSPSPGADLPALRFAGAQILRKKLSDHYDSQLKNDPARKQRVWTFLISSLEAAGAERDELATAIRGKLCEGTAEMIARDLFSDRQRASEGYLEDLRKLCTGPTVQAACEVIGLLPDPMQSIVSEVGSPFRGSRWHSSPEATNCLHQLLPVIDTCLDSMFRIILTKPNDADKLKLSLLQTLHAWMVALGGLFLDKCPAVTNGLSSLLSNCLGSNRQPPVYYEVLEQLLVIIPSLSDTYRTLDLNQGVSAEVLLSRTGHSVDAVAIQCLRSISYYSRQVILAFKERSDTLPRSFMRTFSHFPEAVLLPSLEDEQHTCAIASLLGRFCSSQMGFACIGVLDQTSSSCCFGDEALSALSALMCTTPPVFNIGNLAIVDLLEALHLFNETNPLRDSQSFHHLMLQITTKLLEDWWARAVLILHRDNFYNHYTHEILPHSLCDLDSAELADLEDAMRDRQQIFDTAEDLPGIIVQTQRLRGDLTVLTAMLGSIVNCFEGLSSTEVSGSRAGSLEVLIKLSEIFLEVVVSVMRSMSLEGAPLLWNGSMPQTLMRAVLRCWAKCKSDSPGDRLVSDSSFAFLEAALLQADNALDADDWNLTLGQVCDHFRLNPLAASRCLHLLSSLHPNFFLGNADGSIIASTAASTLANLISSEVANNTIFVMATLNAALLEGIRTAKNPLEGTNVCLSLINRAMTPLALLNGSFTESSILAFPAEQLATVIGSLIILFKQTSIIISEMKSESQLSYWYGSSLFGAAENAVNQKRPWETLLHVCLHLCCSENLPGHQNDPSLRKVIPNEELRTQLSYATDESMDAGQETYLFSDSFITLVRLAFAVMSDFMTITLSRKVPEAEMQKELFNASFMALKDACVKGRMSLVQGGPCALLAHMLRISLPNLRLPAMHFLADRPIVELTQTMSMWRRVDLVTPMWQLHLMLMTFLGRNNYRKFVSDSPEVTVALHQASSFALQTCDGALISVALKVMSAWLVPLTKEWQEVLLMMMDYMVFWPSRVLSDVLHLLERCVFNDENHLQTFLKLLDAHWNDPTSVVVIDDVSSLPALINADHRRLVLRCIQGLRGIRLRQLFDDLSKLCHHSAHPDIFVSYEMLLSNIAATQAPAFVADIG